MGTWTCVDCGKKGTGLFDCMHDMTKCQHCRTVLKDGEICRVCRDLYGRTEEINAEQKAEILTGSATHIAVGSPGQVLCLDGKYRDVVPMPPLTTAIKFDDGKHMFSLVPIKALSELARLYTFGAKKYAPDNWRLGLKYRRCADALLRHLTAWIDGEDIDQESGMHHMAAVAFYAFAVMEFHFTGRGGELDDRYKPAGNQSPTYKELYPDLKDSDGDCV